MLNVRLVKEYKKAKEIVKELAPCGAIECEYGDQTITEDDEGVKIAMYHHGKNSHLPAPSERWDVYDNLKRGLDNFVLSHIDLDAIMGIMWASKILKPTPIAKEIGKLVSLQDTKGFHYVENEILSTLRPTVKYRFLGIGYLVSNLDIGKSNETVQDVSRSVHKLILKIKDTIIDGIDEKLKDHIHKWLNEKNIEAEKHMILFDEIHKIRIFSGDKNMLNAYSIDGKRSDINIQYNSGNGSITISAFDEEFAKKYFGEEGVLKPLLNIFGTDAGGRITVGGTPRDQKYSFEDAMKLYRYIKKTINIPKQLISNEMV